MLWAGVDEVVVRLCVRKCEREEWLGAENTILSRCGSVSDATCKTVAKGEGGRWWDGTDEVVVGGGAVRSQTLAGGGAWGRKPETELMWLGFRYAV
jgi:hypothetical protein